MCYGIVPLKVENRLVQCKRDCYYASELAGEENATDESRASRGVELGDLSIAIAEESKGEELKALMSMMSFDANEYDMNMLAVNEPQL